MNKALALARAVNANRMDDAHAMASAYIWQTNKMDNERGMYA